MKPAIKIIFVLTVMVGAFPVWSQNVSRAKCQKINKEVDPICDKSNKGEGDACSADPHYSPQFILGGLEVTPPKDMPEGAVLARGIKEHLAACTCIEVTPCRLAVITEKMNEYLEVQGYSYAKAIIPKQSITGIDAYDGYALKVDLYQPIITATLFDSSNIDYAELSLQQTQAVHNAKQQLPLSFRENSILSQNLIDRGIYDLSNISGIGLDYKKIESMQGKENSPFDIVFDKAFPEKKTLGYRVIVRPTPVQEPILDFSLDNHGTNYSKNPNDKLNYGAGITYKGLLNSLDFLRIGFSKTVIGTDSIHSGLLLKKSMPNLGSGGNLSINLDYFRYKVQGDFESINARGSVASLGSNLTIRMSRTESYTNFLYLAPEYKLLSDEQASGQFNNTRRIFSARAGVNGSGLTNKSLFGGNGFNYFFDTSLMLGFNFLITPEMADLDSNNSVGHSKGGIFLKPSGTSKFTANTKQFGQEIRLSGALQWQFTSKNLDSSEKFSLGGPLTVRGYPVGHVSTDEAMVVNGEIASPINQTYQVFFTVDGAVGSVYKNPISGVDTQNNKKLASYGFGVEGIVENVFFRAEIGVPTQSNSTTQAWLRVNYKF